MPYLELNQHKIHYKILEGVLPSDTIFLHGNLASITWWEPLTNELIRIRESGRTGRAILMDWRGFGKSTLPPGKNQLKMEEVAGDVLDLLERLDVNKVNLVGHSTGGIIGLLAAAEKPQLMGKILLIDSVSARGIEFPPEFLSLFEQMRTNRELCSQIMSGTIRNVDAAGVFFNRLVDDAMGAAPEVWTGVVSNLVGVDFREKLKRISSPTMVLHGEFDNLLPIQGSRELAELISNARFVELAGCGHSPNVEAPGLIVEMMNAFLMQ